MIDGQGGGIGKHITERIRQALPPEVEIVALGTNAMATAAMLRAGANEGASGENALVQNVGEVNVVVGSISILMPHSMMGEYTPAMAEAVSRSKALKVVLPINRSRVEVVNVQPEPLPHQVDALVERLKKLLESDKNV